MARKNVSTLPDDEVEVRAKDAPASGRGYDDIDSRFLDLEDEAESPFLRGQKRVPVRRGALPRKAADRIKLLLIVLLWVGLVGLVAVTFYRYGTQSWRFRIDSGDNIEVVGTGHVARWQVMEVFGSDIDRNIFFVPLSERKKQLEEIPWVESAAVMRLYPNRLRVVLQERVPVAFVEVNSHIALIDANGVIMDLPAGQQASYSFPVIVGMSDAEPLSTRAARMKIYRQLVKELDSGGSQYSKNLSDVDLSDPEDVKATVADPQGAVLVHLGSGNFLERFRIYITHVQEWRAQFLKLTSVDLRYEHQVIVNPDSAEEKQNSAPVPKANPSGRNTAKPATTDMDTGADHKTKAKKK